MQINSLNDLKRFVLECNSISIIDKVVSASLGVYLISDESTLEQVKEATIDFIDEWKSEIDKPIFLITNKN